MNLDLEEMKRKIFLKAGLLLVAGILAACSSNDDNSENDGKKVDVAKAVEFKVNFSDYNADEEVQGTRAADSQKNDTLSKQVVDLGNDILAEVTVQRDTTLTKAKPHPSTRVLEDGNYTLLAYIAGTGGNLAGKIKGFVKDGAFMHTDNNVLELVPGTYDFVLFNDKVNNSGAYSFSVNRANVGTAIVGREENVVILPSPRHQQVTFNMKHVGARMKLRLQCYMSHDGLGGKLSGSVPSFGIGDLSLDAHIAGWSPAPWSGNVSFPAVSFGFDNITDFYKLSLPTDYQYFFSDTDVSDLKLTLNSGTIYNTDLATHPVTIDLAPDPGVITEGNKSYIINVKLMRNVWYLMSDGSIGLTKETTYGGGTKTPVGIVLSRSRHIAVALKNAVLDGREDIDAFYNSTWAAMNVQSNYRIFTLNNSYSANAINDMDGRKYTWEPAGSADGTTVKATALYDGVHPTYPAFYAAGHYRQQLTASGITLTNGMESKDWYLPSWGEGAYIFSELYRLDKSKLIQNTNSAIYVNIAGMGDIAAAPFRQVQGRPLLGGDRNGWYYNSTEFIEYSIYKYFGSMNLSFHSVNFMPTGKGGTRWYVRPFIIY